MNVGSMALRWAAVMLSSVTVCAQSPVDFTTEHDLALAAYYGGRLEEAIEHYTRCAQLEPPAATRSQIALASANLAHALECNGQRDKALEWALRAADGADARRLHWFEGRSQLAELRADPRFEPVRAALAAARETAIAERRKLLRARRTELDAVRALRDASRIRWRDGHSSQVLDSAFSPDGERIVSTAKDRTVLLWSTDVEELPRVLGTHSDDQVDLSFSDDGERILVVDRAAGTATVYGGRSGNFGYALHESDEFVLDAELGSDGRAWTVTDEGELCFWDTRGGQVLRATTPGVQTLDVAPEGDRVIALGLDSQVYVLDSTTLQPLRRVGHSDVSYVEAACGPGGRVYANGADGTHSLWDSEGERAAIDIAGGVGRRLSILTSDGTRLVAEAPNGDLCLWDSATGGFVATLLDAQVGSSRLAVGAGDLLAVASGGSKTRAHVFSCSTGSELGFVRTASSIFELSLSLDGQLAIGTGDGLYITRADGSGRDLSGHASSLTRTWVGANGLVASSQPTRLPIHSERGAPYSPDLRRAFRFPMRVWDGTTGRLRAAIDATSAEAPRFGAAENLTDVDIGRAPMPVMQIVRFSPDGTRLALTETRPGRQTSILMSRGGEILGSVPGNRSIRTQRETCPAFFSPDGGLLLSVRGRGTIVVASAEDASEFEELEGHSSVVTCMTFDPDGTRLASMGGDGTVCLWDLDGSFELAASFPAHDGIGWCCTFTLDGAQLVTGGADGIVRVWDAETGALVRELTGHTDDVRRTKLHPTSGRLVTASYDSTLRIWDVETGETHRVLRGHTAALENVEFLDDGRLMSHALDSTVRVWDHESGRLLATRVEYDQESWLTFEPNGHYVAGGRAEEWAQVQVGGTTYPLSSYAGRLRDPDKVRRALAGERIPAPIFLGEAPRLRTGTPQTGEIDEPRLRFTVLFEDEGGLTDLVVERDGEVWQQGLDHASIRFDPGRRSGTIDLEVPVAEGRTRIEVRVRATNGDGIKSVPLTVARDYVPPTGDLFLLAIAVDDYDDNRLDLAAPVKDAAAIVARLGAERGALYDHVHARVFGGEGGEPVTSAAIAEAYEWLYADAQEEDTIIVFVAGHGARTASGRYYFLTPDATLERPTRGIKGDDLYDLVTSEDLAPRRRVLLIDTCHAGGELEPGERGIGGADAFTQEQIDESAGSGIYIVSGSTEQGTAGETAEHGIFTAALLDGLDGAADTDSDGRIDIAEWIEHARRSVAETDGAQRVTTPRVVGGDAFPIARSR